MGGSREQDREFYKSRDKRGDWEYAQKSLDDSMQRFRTRTTAKASDVVQARFDESYSSGPAELFDFGKLEFFESGDEDLKRIEPHYGNRFPKSSTRRVAVELTIRANKHEVCTIGLFGTFAVHWTLATRYFKPDGSLLGETEQKISFSAPGRHWFRRRWGWSEPDNWPVGTYRVEMLFEGQVVAKGEFTILADEPRESIFPFASDGELLRVFGIRRSGSAT